MANISENIKILEKIVWHGTEKYNFNARIDIEKIETFAKAYGLKFSESYKKFLARFNGGMIMEHNIHFYTDMLEDEPDGAKWSSNFFFPLNELIEKYRDLKLDDWLLSDRFKGIYPIIPICKTSEQNLLFMISQRGLKNESPVFGSHGDAGIGSCIQVAKNFNSFFEAYMEYEGFPPLKSKSEKLSCKSFMDENNILNIATKDESYEEIIERTTAMIKLFPDHDWPYCERGNAHRYNEYPKEALEDFNKAIELVKDAFYYHCRGDLLLNYGSPRKALIDMDIAVKLKPDNLLFLSGRADAFYKLGKLNKALADCNSILKVDNKDKLALMTRVKIYKDMGENEKAKADSEVLDNLEW